MLQPVEGLDKHSAICRSNKLRDMEVTLRSHGPDDSKDPNLKTKKTEESSTENSTEVINVKDWL